MARSARAGMAGDASASCRHRDVCNVKKRLPIAAQFASVFDILGEDVSGPAAKIAPSLGADDHNAVASRAQPRFWVAMRAQWAFAGRLNVGMA